jgi:hypothetical protein
MKLQLHEGGLEILGVVNMPDVLKESIPQGDARVDDRSMAGRKGGAEERPKALQVPLGVFDLANQVGELVPQ